MMTIRIACAALMLSFLAGCHSIGGGLSKDEQTRLAQFQSNASLYWEGKHYDQALEMVRKGLDLDPQDYKLLSLGGWCYLQLSETDTQRLLDAERYFDEVYKQRDPDDHLPHALLGYAATKQRLGREHRRLADTLAREAETRDLTETERTIRASRAKEHAQRAKSYWADAIRTLNDLIDREELLRFAHKLLMETYVELGDYDKAVEHGELCLARNHDEQELKNANIRETRSLADEQLTRAQLQELIDQERRVRSALAEMHFRKGAFAKSVEQLDELLRSDPNRSTDYYNRGLAYERLGRDLEARADYQKFLGTTLLPSNDERVAHAYEFSERLGSNPTPTTIEAFVILGNLPKAVEFGEQELAKNLERQETLRTTIRSAPDSTSEQTARAELQTLVDRSVVLRSTLADVHLRSRDHEKALRQLDELLRADPTRFDDYYRRGITRERLGLIDEARADFQRFLGSVSLPQDDERVAHAREFIRLH